MATSNTMMVTHRSKKIKGESKTYYEKSLISTLRNFQRTSNLTDFTIICRDQEKIQSHKLLLATRSKHFENLFTHEPETNTISLDYQVRIVKILTNSLVTGNFGHVEFDDCVELFRLTDYLLMDDFRNEVEAILADNLNVENIDEIVDLAETFINIPTLNYKCQKFTKENICLIDLTKISKGFLKSLITSPTCYIKDVNGRFMDFIESEVKFVEALDNLDPNEDWNIPIMSKRRIDLACTSAGSANSMAISEKMRKRSSHIVEKFSDKNKYLPKSHETIWSKLSRSERYELNNGRYNISWRIGPFGMKDHGYSYHHHPMSRRWSVEGPFRKISVKTRTYNELQIVQGLKFEFEDGTVEAYGMEINDETDVTELEVPKGQHIKDVVLRSEKYINQIGFTTNEGWIFGPVGGNGGKRSYGQFYYYNAAQKYVHDIKGTTVIGNDGEPFIAEFEFRYIYLI